MWMILTNIILNETKLICGHGLPGGEAGEMGTQEVSGIFPAMFCFFIWDLVTQTNE
jgi:hypothetical protein